METWATRRGFLSGACSLVAGSLTACGGPAGRESGSPDRVAASPSAEQAAASRGRLLFRPEDMGDRPGGKTGILQLEGVTAAQPGAAFVPSAADGKPMRLVLLLHGAGGQARRALHLLLPVAERERLLLVAPKSLASTWDVIAGGFGPDVRNIDHLLGEVAAAYPVSSYTVSGFSDGASYALTLGVGNGDIFDSVMAFSPGFVAARVAHGRPRFFVSHGTDDQVLPLHRTSRRLVPQLKREGYDVTYEEFEGRHEVPPGIVDRAVTWLGRRSVRA